MAKKRKHQFHCERCGSGCEIYKKGKGHRVLVCPRCGILATNPLPLLALGAQAVGSAIASKVMGGGEKKKESNVNINKNYDIKVDKYSTEEKVRDALK